MFGRPNGFIFPSSQAFFDAKELAREASLKEIEYAFSNLDSADDDTLRVRIGNMREDIAATLLMQNMIHRQLVTISRGIWFMAITALFVLALITD